MFTNTIINLSYLTNTTVPIANQNAPALKSNQPDVVLAILITMGILILIKLAGMVYTIYYIEYNKYLYRKNINKRQAALSAENLKNIYSTLRTKHNGTQMEFPFVKAMDDAYVDARYNLKEEES